MRNASRARRPKAKKATAPQRRASQRQSGGQQTAKGADSLAERGFLFEDPYWDDAFCSYYDPTLRTCCRR